MRDSAVLKYYGESCECFYGDGGHRESETEWIMENSLYWALGPPGVPSSLFPCILGPCREGEEKPTNAQAFQEELSCLIFEILVCFVNFKWCSTVSQTVKTKMLDSNTLLFYFSLRTRITSN